MNRKNAAFAMKTGIALCLMDALLIGILVVIGFASNNHRNHPAATAYFAGPPIFTSTTPCRGTVAENASRTLPRFL